MKYFKILSMLLVTSLYSTDTLSVAKVKCELAAMIAKSEKITSIMKVIKSDYLIDYAKKIAFDNKEALRLIIYEFGWLNISDFGHEACDQAWSIIQYTDDLSLQKYCLPLIKEAWENNEARGKHYAYLYDRIAIREGRKQKYATQFDEAFKLYPIEDMKKVDKFRKAVGLSKIEDYLSTVYKGLI